MSFWRGKALRGIRDTEEPIDLVEVPGATKANPSDVPEPRSYMGIANDFAAELDEELSIGNKQLQLSLIAYYQREEIRAALTEIARASTAELAHLSSDEFERLVNKNFQRLNLHNLTDFNRQLRTQFKVQTVEAVQPWLSDESVARALARENATTVSKIKTISSEYFDELNALVREGFEKGWSGDKLGKEISQRFGVKLSRGRFIARNEIGNLNATLSQHRQTQVGVDSYIWRTSMDERVRPSHAIKDNVKFRWASPPLDTGPPGADYNCRCTAEPVFPDLDDIMGQS